MPEPFQIDIPEAKNFPGDTASTEIHGSIRVLATQLQGYCAAQHTANQAMVQAIDDLRADNFDAHAEIKQIAKDADSKATANEESIKTAKVWLRVLRWAWALVLLLFLKAPQALGKFLAGLIDAGGSS